MSDSTRQQMSATEMRSRLEAEFAKVRPEACKKCVVPRTFWGPSAGPGQGFWYMEQAKECPHGCNKVIAQLWARFTTDYAIAAPDQTRRSKYTT